MTDLSNVWLFYIVSDLWITFLFNFWLDKSALWIEFVIIIITTNTHTHTPVQPDRSISLMRSDVTFRSSEPFGCFFPPDWSPRFISRRNICCWRKLPILHCCRNLNHTIILTHIQTISYSQTRTPHSLFLSLTHFFLTQTHYRHLFFTVSLYQTHTHSLFSTITDSWKDFISFSQLPVCPSRCDSNLHIERLTLHQVSPAVQGRFVHI